MVRFAGAIGEIPTIRLNAVDYAHYPIADQKRSHNQTPGPYLSESFAQTKQIRPRGVRTLSMPAESIGSRISAI
jgi:hypothetical protein